MKMSGEGMIEFQQVFDQEFHERDHFIGKKERTCPSKNLKVSNSTI